MRPDLLPASAIPGLIAEGETYTIEFKTDANDDELVNAVVCLTNGDGGWLLLGVDDDGTVVGARPRHGDDTDGSRLAALVANKTSPPVVINVGECEIGDKLVTVIRVPKATRGVVATTAGRYVRRALDINGKPQCLPMMPHEALARTVDIGAQDLSSLPQPTLTLAELDALELSRFRALAGADGDTALAKLSDLDLLSALGLRTVDGALTLGAALLFGSVPVIRKLLPTHETAFQVLNRADAVEANRIEHAPLLRSMVSLVEAVKPYNPEDEIDDGLFRTGLPRYAQAAVRELVANALVHRDYTAPGQVRIAIESEVLAVSSPGGFPGGLRIGNLLTAPPRARNPLIADAFKRAGLVERVGRGVNRVFRSQLAIGRPAADYSRSTRSWVEARLLPVPLDRALAGYVAASAREGHHLALPTLQILREVRTDGRVSAERAAVLLQVFEDEAEAVLEHLVDERLLEARGEGSRRTYHLSATLQEALAGATTLTGRPASTQPYGLILGYVDRHGSIARSDVVDLCSVTPDQATVLLRRLVDKGELRMTGQRRGARYQR